MSNIIKICFGHTPSFLKDSSHWFNDIKDHRVKEILVSFNVVYIFKEILMDDAIETIEEITNGDTTNVVKMFSKFSYFSL